MIFYKGVLLSDLRDSYVPGTVTTDANEALMWKERIESRKSKGAAKHVRHGKSCVIRIVFDGVINDHTHFQKAGIAEHSRVNCWTSAAKVKAQINTPCAYELINL